MNKVERHEELCKLIHETYKAKNSDYGDSVHELFVKLGPVTVATRLGDKYNRICSLLQKGLEDQKVKSESILDTFLDLANYAIIGYLEMEEYLNNKSLETNPISDPLKIYGVDMSTEKIKNTIKDFKFDDMHIPNDIKSGVYINLRSFIFSIFSHLTIKYKYDVAVHKLEAIRIDLSDKYLLKSLSFKDFTSCIIATIGSSQDIDYDDMNKRISTELGLSGTIVDIKIIDKNTIEVSQTSNSGSITNIEPTLKTTSRSIKSALGCDDSCERIEPKTKDK